MVISVLQQTGLPPGQWLGTTKIGHSGLSGLATRFEQSTGLTVLLLDYQTQAYLSIAEPIASTPSLSLWFTMVRSADSDQVAFQISVGSFEWHLKPNQSCRQQVIHLGTQWLHENLPPSISLESLEVDLQRLLARDTLLSQLIREEIEKVWERYYQQNLQPLFVWKVVYSLLFQLFDRLQQQSYPSRYTLADRQRVEAVQQYLTHNLSNSAISVTSLAQMATMSLTKFNRLFKELYSVSVKEYLTEKRLQAASELLATHRYTVSQVAVKVGFTNASGLTKLFQKKYGISPKAI